MSTDPASLEGLHDVVLPQPIPWWPPAPGWIVLGCLLLCALAWFLWRYWRNWRANAYRREALRQLDRLDDPVAISELLRRTALAIAPRSDIARLTGDAWPEWLAVRAGTPMPAGVRRQLGSGLYGPALDQPTGQELPAYARRWIRCHQIPDTNLPESA